MADRGIFRGLERSTRGLPQLATQLYGLKQRGEIARAGIGLRERELESRERISDTTGRRAADTLAERKTANIVREDLAERKFKRKQAERHPAQRQLPSQTWLDLRSKITTNVKDISPKSAKVIEPIMEEMEALVGRGATPTMLKSYWDTRGTSTKTKLKETLRSELDATTDPAKRDQITEMMTALASDQFSEIIFPLATHYEQLQKEEQARAIALKQAGRVVEKFGEPTLDRFGNLVQENLETGKTSKVSSPSKGMEITTADGTTIRTGVPTGKGGMERPTTALIEKNLFQSKEQGARLDSINAKFKPEYQQLGTRWSAFETKWKEKLQGTPLERFVNLDVTPEEKKLLADYTDYRQDAMTNLNKSIKDTTGAQMSEKEVPRLKKQMPDPGQGLFDGDSPTEFKRKLDSKIVLLKKANARYMFYLSQGLTAKQTTGLIKSNAAMGLDDIGKVIDSRGEQIAIEIKNANPEMAQDEIDNAVGQQLRQEFGG